MSEQKYTYIVSDAYWKIRQFAVLNKLSENSVKWIDTVKKIMGLRSGTTLNVLCLSNDLKEYDNIINYAKSKEFNIVYIMN